MIFLAESAIFYPHGGFGLCLLLFADTMAMQSLGEVLPIK